MTQRILVPLLFSSGLLRAVVYTCSPPPTTPLCQFPRKVDITFVGTAIDTNYDPNPPGGGDLAFFGMWYRFSVDEVFTGLRPNEKEVVAWLSLGGGSPEIGRKFFVHAQREGDRIRLASCGNTRRAEDASEDIGDLRKKLKGDFTPYIVGSVLRNYKGSQYAIESELEGLPRGLAGAKIALDGPSGVLKVVSDEQGRFRVNDVKPGNYAMTAESSGYRMAQTVTVEVPQDGCGIAHVGVFTNAGISGIVRRSDGTPAKDVELDLIDADPGYLSRTNHAPSIKTGSQGEFSLTNLPSGRFLLGVNIEESSRYPDQTPPSYYPGVAARGDAEVIELGPNEVRTGLVLTLLPPRAFRLVRVHLQWPDGTIPRGGAMNAWANRGIYVSKYELKDGIFELNLLQGVDYWLDAAALDESRKPTQFARGTWVYADNYRLSAGTDTVDVTMTALFAEPQWSKAIYPRVETSK